jgi:cellulose synthase/poly-beta-1,6-N-acetylglucosamine synthase-like glycosyltransferase
VIAGFAGTVAAVSARHLAGRYLPARTAPGNGRLVRLTWLGVAGVGALAVALAVVELVPYGQSITIVVWLAVSALMFVVAGLTLLRTQYTWQLPERVDHVDLDDIAEPQLRFSLIVPARDEPVLGRTLDQILGGGYPLGLLEILLVVSDDEVDRETRAIAEDYAARYANVLLLSPTGTKRSKPVSLEDARRRCTGDLVGIVDAESLLARGVLAYVNTLAVRNPGVGIFQGGVQLMNVRAAGWQRPKTRNAARVGLDWLDRGTSWWRARNCLEYYIWFMSRLRYQAAARFIPLGGNTVFARRTVLDALGGWDVSCLTEDCDLGVRASVAGVETAVFYHPALTTREETPESLTKLVVQRTRWMMGFIQVLRKGDWRELPGARRRLLALEMLSMPFFQAFSGLTLPLSLLLFFVLDAPVGLVIIYCLPLGVTILLIVAEEAAFRELMAAYTMKVRLLDSVRLVVFAPMYQLVLSVAAVRAAVRLLKGEFEWEKTSHVGAHHLGSTPGTELERVS